MKKNKFRGIIQRHLNIVFVEFQEAIRKIEERGDFNRYVEMKPIFDARLEELKPDDHTQRAICYYYLLISYLKAQLVHETDEMQDYFERMDASFQKQLEVYKKNRKNFVWQEMRDFFYLAERSYESLEFIFHDHHFKKSERDAYLIKMRFKKEEYRFHREWLSYIEYCLLEWSSDYGVKVYRWALTTLLFNVLMGFVYWTLDASTVEGMFMTPIMHWYDYFYFSIITTTTIGFGDITPVTFIAKMITSIHAFLGFLMLGVFIGMIQKRL